jgi:hypothetical protein
MFVSTQGKSRPWQHQAMSYNLCWSYGALLAPEFLYLYTSIGKVVCYHCKLHLTFTFYSINILPSVLVCLCVSLKAFMTKHLDTARHHVFTSQQDMATFLLYIAA